MTGSRDTDDRTHDTVGMRFAFWAWMTIVVVGLAIMIAVPLTGR